MCLVLTCLEDTVDLATLQSGLARSACDKAKAPQAYIQANFPDAKLETQVFDVFWVHFFAVSLLLAFQGCMQIFSSGTSTSTRIRQEKPETG